MYVSVYVAYKYSASHPRVVEGHGSIGTRACRYCISTAPTAVSINSHRAQRKGRQGLQYSPLRLVTINLRHSTPKFPFYNFLDGGLHEHSCILHVLVESCCSFISVRSTAWFPSTHATRCSHSRNLCNVGRYCLCRTYKHAAPLLVTIL